MLKEVLKSMIMIVCIGVITFTFVSCKVTEDTVQPEPPRPEPEAPLTDEEQQALADLNPAIIPLEAASPLELSDAQLSALDGLNGARIVGMGEAVHAAREMSHMKFRVFRYLVEHCGHRAIGLQADFAEAVYLDRWVTGGAGDGEELMKRYMHIWMFRTKPILEMLQWMRNYNTGRADGDKIHFFGLDCVYSDLHPGLLRDYYERTVPQLWTQGADVITEVGGLGYYDYPGVTADRYNDVLSRLELLESRVETRKEKLIDRSSEWEYAIHRRLLTTLKQSFVVWYRIRVVDENDGYSLRSSYWAENAVWCADRFGPGGKISVWAHNGLLARGDSVGWNGMGAFLDRREYVPVAFSMSRGEFMALDKRGDQGGRLVTAQLDTDPVAHSINRLFSHADHANFMLNPANINAGSTLDSWLSALRPFLLIGGVYEGIPEDYYYDLVLRDDYDWVIHINETTAARVL